MAMVHDPEILVLDEPITGLDPQSRLQVSDFIRELCNEQGKTVILTTHLMEVAARISDRIAIMDHGKLKALDTLDNLKKSIGEGDIVEISISGDAEQGKVLDIVKSLDGVESAGLYDCTTDWWNNNAPGRRNRLPPPSPGTSSDPPAIHRTG